MKEATGLQVTENMLEMMQLKKSNSINHAKQAKRKQEKKSYPAIVIEIDDA